MGIIRDVIEEEGVLERQQKYVLEINCEEEWS